MKVTRLTLRDFTVFIQDTTFDFAPGVNVLIGENGTGKSHVLKLIYVLTEAVRRFASGQGIEGRKTSTLDTLVRELLMDVFQPDTLGNFASSERGQATASLEWEADRIEVSLGPGDALAVSVTGSFSSSSIGPALFIPPREVLSMYPGFVSAWLKRESAFDRTYFDLCVALGLKLLRAGVPKAILDPIERALHGSVFMKDGRFFIHYDGGGGDMEIPMVAEGDRKLAMIAYLLMNGSLSEKSTLLWDEPEANLNPKRALLTSDTATGLAHAGVQVFLATHDYALTSELDLQVATGALGAGEAAFFSLHRNGDVKVFRGDRLAELQDNPILDALASLHDREQTAFFTSDQAPR